MRAAELVTLTMRELDRLKVIQAIVEMGLKPWRAAERLGLSVRQVERLTVRYRSRVPRLGKVPRSAFDAHRPPRTVETTCDHRGD